MHTTRKSYPSDISDAEWEFLLPYLTLMRADALQRAHDMREVFNAIRYVVRTDCQWRMLPHDLPRGPARHETLDVVLEDEETRHLSTRVARAR